MVVMCRLATTVLVITTVVLMKHVQGGNVP
jgi:hypothetical protein